MTDTLLFYDLETSGLNKAFSQVLQFAGKRVDLNFHEKESCFYEIKPNIDMIPDLAAVLIHNITPKHMHDHMEEMRAMRLIHDMFNTPKTITIGYNTLGFDDEFLRFSFYKNLLPPYTHQYANGCKRMDLFPMVVFYYLYAQEALKWPHIDGKVSLKLERLAEENGFLTGHAHHAMHDVDMTIKLAKTMKEANEDIWSWCIQYFDKNTDMMRVSQLPEAFIDSTGHHFGLMIAPYFGAKAEFQAPVLSLGRHNHYKNQVVFLRLDQPIDAFDFDVLDGQGCIIRKKWAEPGFLLPMNDRYAKHMSEERKRVCDDNLSKLRLAPDILKELSHKARAYVHPEVENIDADCALYEVGFFNQEEEALARKFHMVDEPTQVKMIEDFKNPRQKELAVRALWRKNPHLPALKSQKELQEYILALKTSQPIYDYRGNERLSIEGLKNQINAIKQQSTLSDQQKALIDDVESYIALLQEQW